MGTAAAAFNRIGSRRLSPDSGIYAIFTGHPLFFAPSFQPSAYAPWCPDRMWRCAMDDLFMLGVMLGFFLLMTFLIELCAWLVRRR